MDGYDTLVVGAGYAGSIMAERLARDDRRDHIAGNAGDYYDKHGVLVHKYGQLCVARRSFHTPGRRALAILRDGDFRTLAAKARSKSPQRRTS